MPRETFGLSGTGTRPRLLVGLGPKRVLFRRSGPHDYYARWRQLST